jgi:hypothetical protein
MKRIQNKDLIWVRPDVRFDGDHVIGSKPSKQVGPDQTEVGKSKSKRARPTDGDYTVSQLAEEWGFSTDKIRDLFRNEPGVVKLRDENASKKRKRSYVTLRIPPEVAQRVKRRLS